MKKRQEDRVKREVVLCRVCATDWAQVVRSGFKKEGGGRLLFPASRKTEMTKNQMRCDSGLFAEPVLGRRLASMLSL
jgi:hypothetical protein